MSMKNPIILFLFLTAFIVSTTPVYAYMDPGTGSMLLQALIGGVAAVFVVISVYYQRIKAVCLRRFFVSGKNRKSSTD
jgi:hypothetical protein